MEVKLSGLGTMLSISPRGFFEKRSTDLTVPLEDIDISGSSKNRSLWVR